MQYVIHHQDAGIIYGPYTTAQAATDDAAKLKASLLAGTVSVQVLLPPITQPV